MDIKLVFSQYEKNILNRALRRIFEPKREEVAGGWRRLHNEELHNLYATQSVIKVIKPRNMMWASHSTRWEVIKIYKNICRKTSREETSWKT
jgi:hypothetical protein